MADRRPVLIAGAGLIAGAIAVALMPFALGHAWLAALVFWSGVPVGAIGLRLATALLGGRWRGALGPALTGGAAALPAVAIAALPLLIVMGAIYPWAGTVLPGFRGAWLQPWAFALRTILWFAGLAALLVALRRRDRPHPAAAVAGLAFVVLAGSLIAVDWVQSLAPAFHSSAFGLQVLTIHFGIALMLAAIRAGPDPTGTIGALMLTLLLLWGYFAYLPFFVVWSGNVPAGAAWYLARASGGWGAVSMLAVLLHALPLLVLLSGRMRRDRRAVVGCALASLAGDALYCAWLVLPARGVVHPLPAASYLAALALVGAPVLLLSRRR